MILGNPYRTPLIQNNYDAIIVGSGIGGLTLAGLLAKANKRVLVLEKHYTAGGFTHVFKRKGYEWDVGLHYIGEVHRETSVLRKLFDYLTNGQLQWAFMGETYDRIIIGNDCYDFKAGTENFIQSMKSYFPGEEKAIENYVNLVYQVSKGSSGFYGEKVFPQWSSPFLSPLMGRTFSRYAKMTTAEVLSKLTSNLKLQAVLTGQYGDYGLPPKMSSFAMHAILVKHYFSGGNYPIGGSSALARTMIPVIEKAGGQVIVKAPVAKVLLDSEGSKGSQRAIGVELENGHQIFAQSVISNIGLLNSLQNLLPNEVTTSWPHRDDFNNTQRSLAHLCVYLGLKGSSEELKLPKYNYWIYPDYDHDASYANYIKNHKAPPAVSYISFPSSKDPSWSERFPDKSTIEIVGVAPYKWFEKWKETPWRRRGDEYNQWKDQLVAPHFERLFQHFPHLRDKIDYSETSSPLSTEHFCSYNKGEIYGLEHTPYRMAKRWPRPETPLRNFYLTGQDIVTAGIGGAAMGGVLTAVRLLKRNVMKDILKEKA